MANNRPINEYLSYLLAQAERQLNRQLDQEFRAEGVPVEQWRILKLLAEKNGRSMGESFDQQAGQSPAVTPTGSRQEGQSGGSAMSMTARSGAIAVAVRRRKSRGGCCSAGEAGMK